MFDAFLRDFLEQGVGQQPAPISKEWEYGFVFYKKEFIPGYHGYDTTGNYGSRAPFFIHFRRNGVEFCVLSAHLDPASQDMRRCGAVSAALFVKSCPVPTFFLGDFNVHKNERDDFYARLPECSSCQTAMKIKPTSFKSKQPFDDIVFEKSCIELVGDPMVVNIPGMGESERPSDHDPVVAKFTIQASKKTTVTVSIPKMNVKQLKGPIIGKVWIFVLDLFDWNQGVDLMDDPLIDRGCFLFFLNHESI